MHIRHDGGEIDMRGQQNAGIGCLSPLNCPALTQVPGHQVGIVEILHSQSNDVDKILDDLHELHCPRIDLDKGEKEQG